MLGSSIRRRMTYANVTSTIALAIALGTGTAYAAVVVTSNADVAKDTISGHKPPTGDHSNIITGSVNATDLATGAVTPVKIKAPEAWHYVAAGSTTQNLCASGQTGVFCSEQPTVTTFSPWQNFGGEFSRAAFYKDQLGIVHLKGLVQAPVVSIGGDPTFTSIFRLPAAYAPGLLRVFASEGDVQLDGLDVAPARIDVRADGVVEFEQDCSSDGSVCSADGGYLTLDGISFRPDE